MLVKKEVEVRTDGSGGQAQDAALLQAVHVLSVDGCFVPPTSFFSIITSSLQLNCGKGAAL